jgi:RecB family exonuclease
MSDRDAASRVAGNVAAFLGGRYAARLRSEGALVHREEPFVVPVASQGGPLFLRGVIDVLALFPDGSAEIVDYKSSFRPEPGVYDFQLMAYALAARRRYDARRVRIGLLNLAAASVPELTDVSTAELDAFELRVATLREGFADARSSGAFGGVERPRCESLRCGFVSACHGA